MKAKHTILKEHVRCTENTMLIVLRVIINPNFSEKKQQTDAKQIASHTSHRTFLFL